MPLSALVQQLQQVPLSAEVAARMERSERLRLGGAGRAARALISSTLAPRLVGVLLGGLVIAAALLAAGQRSAIRPVPQASASERVLMASAEAELLQQLAVADQQWRPQAQPLPGGGTRYVYRKRPGDPDLTIDQIRALMAYPPTFAWERRVIQDLWRRLAELGISLRLSQPRKPGAAGEWDPSQRTLRIKPTVISKGSSEFARVLNHEAIHVAQSCAAGGPQASPRLLGLSQRLPRHLQTVLQEPTYAAAGERERRLEREAYANQDQLELGLSLLNLHC